MKNDSTFKFVAAIILAGVVVALAAPAPTSLVVTDAVVDHAPVTPAAPAGHGTE